MAPLRSKRVEAVSASVLALLGMGLTTWAAFDHLAQLVVPGSTLILVGSSWLGCVLARLNVRLLPFLAVAEHSPATSPPPTGSGPGEG
jgi:hypothetical protein